jgi:hypothetical protein
MNACTRPDGLPRWFVARAPAPQAMFGSLQDVELRQGRFGAIRSLLRVLEGGGAAKAILDLVVDATSAMQNLREAISSNVICKFGHDVLLW